MTQTITEQQQKWLTEKVLGKCWHEPLFPNKQVLPRAFHKCKKCGAAPWITVKPEVEK